MQEMFDYLFNICVHFWELNVHDFCVVSYNWDNCFKQFKFKIFEGIFGNYQKYYPTAESKSNEIN